RHWAHHALRLLYLHRARHRARLDRPAAARRARGGGAARPSRERRAAMDGDRPRRAGPHGPSLPRQGGADAGIVGSPVRSSVSTQTARLSTFAALKGRNYFLYWLGLVFYVLGHRAEYMTFAWITWEVSRDPLTLGYLGLAQGVPLVLFQLFGGVLADRINRLRLLLVTQIAIALTLTAAFVLTVLGLARVEHLLIMAALSGSFRAFDEPSRMALIPQLVARERLPNAIALGSIPWQAGRMIGPSR